MSLRGPGRAIFTAILLLVSGVLNTIYGIGAIGHSHFFTNHEHYVFGSLRTWGWVTLVLGIVELIAGASLMGGGNFGRWIGIIAGSLVAIESLLNIPAYPFLSLAIFALSLWIVYGLTRNEPENYPEHWGVSPSRDVPSAEPGRRPPSW